MYTDGCATSFTDIDLNWVLLVGAQNEDWRTDLMFGEIVMAGAGHLSTKTKVLFEKHLGCLLK